MRPLLKFQRVLKDLSPKLIFTSIWSLKGRDEQTLFWGATDCGEGHHIHLSKMMNGYGNDYKIHCIILKFIRLELILLLSGE
jgi:hypothetical protein